MASPYPMYRADHPDGSYRLSAAVPTQWCSLPGVEVDVGARDEGLSAEALVKGCSSLESLEIDRTVRPFPPAFALMAHICS